MSSKSGAAGAIFIFESEKLHGIRPLKTGMIMVSAFDAFIHIQFKTLPQSLICTEEILLYNYTVHIKLIISISLSFVFGVRGSEMSLDQTLHVLKGPASADNLAKT